jgi:hypothetical protein
LTLTEETDQMCRLSYLQPSVWWTGAEYELRHLGKEVRLLPQQCVYLESLHELSEGDF